MPPSLIGLPLYETVAIPTKYYLTGIVNILDYFLTYRNYENILQHLSQIFTRSLVRDVTKSIEYNDDKKIKLCTWSNEIFGECSSLY